MGLDDHLFRIADKPDLQLLLALVLRLTNAQLLNPDVHGVTASDIWDWLDVRERRGEKVHPNVEYKHWPTERTVQIGLKRLGKEGLARSQPSETGANLWRATQRGNERLRELLLFEPTRPRRPPP